MTEEMEKMVEVFTENDKALRNNNDLYKKYIAPDIPEKIVNKLIKYFDSHLPANSIVAFYDTTLFGSSKGGLLFTNDGFYTKFIGKPVYIAYSSVKSMKQGANGIEIEVDSTEMPTYTLIESLDKKVLEDIIRKLIEIDKEHGQSSFKSSGKVGKKVNLPEDMQKKCHGIIHGAAVACGGVGTGLAQIPASDSVVITPIQIGMITALAKVFDLDITEGAAKGIIASAGAGLAGRTASQFLVGWIPIVGNAINTATAAGLTEAIGWIAVQHFYERWLEDKQKGRYEGMKDGYTEASGEYERKLRKQADEFLNQIKDVKRERDEYEKLLDEYEKYIEELERKCAASEVISEMKTIYDNLKNLESA